MKQQTAKSPKNPIASALHVAGAFLCGQRKMLAPPTRGMARNAANESIRSQLTPSQLRIARVYENTRADPFPGGNRQSAARGPTHQKYRDGGVVHRLRE